ncbi:MAG: glycosyltransferase family 39 protein [Sphingomonas bacterium]|nr:glycosyltransferase family 39 protein [Sphingomonas bacterium]
MLVLPRPWRLVGPVVVSLSIFAAYGAYSFPDLAARWGLPVAGIPIVLVWGAVLGAPIWLYRHGHRRAAVVVGAIGMLVLRGAMAALVAGRIPPGDAEMYLRLADHVRQGRGLEVIEPYMGVETRALFPPFYPMLLALWQMAFGLSTAAITMLNAVIDALTAGLIVMLARTLGHVRAGRGAAWLYLAWPSVLLSAPLAQKEGLCALLVLLLASLWVRFVRAGTPRARDAAAIGVTAGLLALTQPGAAPLAIVFALVAIGTGYRRLFTLALAALPAAVIATMLPWWIRNAVVFGRFVPLTSAGGYGLWIGNNPDATGEWMAPPLHLYGLSELAFGRAAARIAIDWIVGNPGGFIRVTIEKALRAWGVAEAGVSRLAWMKPGVPAVVTGAAFLTAQIAHLAMLSGGAAAAVVTTRMRCEPGTRTLLLLVLACIIQTLCFGDFFQFGERHRDFATPFLLLLALFGMRREPGYSSAESGSSSRGG